MINGLTKVITMTCMLLSSVVSTDINAKTIVKETETIETQIIQGTEVEIETETETEFVPLQIIQPVMSCVVETKEPEMIFTESEIELIALVTMAEAEGESEYGKRLVIDTIINRVESEHFPNTVNEVIYQPHHFESVWNGRIDKCYVDEDICDLVRGEIEEISDPYVMYFCTGDYGRYGEPMYQVGNHYFSSY